MKRFLGAVLVASLMSGSSSSIRADDQDTKAILDKAMKALGGEEKLSKATAASRSPRVHSPLTALTTYSAARRPSKGSITIASEFARQIR